MASNVTYGGWSRSSFYFIYVTEWRGVPMECDIPIKQSSNQAWDQIL